MAPLVPLVLISLVLSGCGGGEPLLRRPPPGPQPAPAVLGLRVEADSALDLSAVEALVRELAAQRGGPLFLQGAVRDLVISVERLELASATRVVQRAAWADDGGPTRRSYQPLPVRELVVDLRPRLEPPRSGALEPVRRRLLVQLGPGGDEHLRLRGERDTVLLLRGGEAAVRDRALHIALDAVLDQVLPPGRVGAPIPVALESGQPSELLPLLEQGRLDEAEAALRAVVAAAPRDAAAVYNLAAVLDARGDFEQALRHYGTALALRPEDEWRATARACEAALVLAREAEAETVDR